MQAQFTFPTELVFDHKGSLYIADQGNHVIRKVAPDGIITTVAGTGSSGSAGNNDPAIQAQLHDLFGIAVDKSGNLFIADTVNNQLRQVDIDGTVTMVVQVDSPSAVAIKDGDLYIVTSQANKAFKVRKVLPAYRP